MEISDEDALPIWLKKAVAVVSMKSLIITLLVFCPPKQADNKGRAIVQIMIHVIFECLVGADFFRFGYLGKLPWSSLLLLRGERDERQLSCFLYVGLSAELLVGLSAGTRLGIVGS